MTTNAEIMGITLGSIRLESPVLLAPMSGITDLPFRHLVRRHGAGLVMSEMIASGEMLRATRQAALKSMRGPNENPLAVQLAGTEPNIMAEAARMNENRGAAVIDINFGCPVKKVVSKQAGSALMRDEVQAARILEAVVDAVKVPVTLKMRTGWDDANRNAPRLAQIAEVSGIQMVTVHGRTRSQLFQGKSDWAFIRAVKEAVSIPVVANGDINSVEDAESCMKVSGADGVMIGRASRGRPWFLQQVAHFLRTGIRLPDPPIEIRLATLIEHLDSMFIHYGRAHGLRIARKHVAWYSRDLARCDEFCGAVNSSEDPLHVKSLITRYFANPVDGW